MLLPVTVTLRMLGVHKQLKTTAKFRVFWSSELRNFLAGKQGYREIYCFHLQDRTTSREGQNWY
jgi:hypothetical protein